MEETAGLAQVREVARQCRNRNADDAVVAALFHPAARDSDGRPVGGQKFVHSCL